MRYAGMLLVLACVVSPLLAQEKVEEGPSNEKAQKTYKQALEFLQRRMPDAALESFKKADKQDSGHCVACQKNMIKYGIEFGEWKTAEVAAGERVAEARDEKSVALAHYDFGFLLLAEGITKRKDELFARSHDEMSKALAVAPNFQAAIFVDGQALGHLKQDDAAKARFEQFVKMRPTNDLDRQRALRYISRPELVRARMAPPFAITTTGGQRISLDDLKGKVVLIDFWATWCAPCREAVPHLKAIAKKFQGQPLVVLSVSLDSDEQKWKDFIAKNEMTWLQYRDGGFDGPMAKLFAVNAIPHTFTIDTDGVLQDEHIGDTAIEGKLKKLVDRARELQVAEKPRQ
jgi:thiol-disulfide isomerase/thioredoxin